MAAVGGRSFRGSKRMGRWMVIPTAVGHDLPAKPGYDQPEEWEPKWCVIDGEADDAPLVENISKGTAIMVAEGLNLRDAVLACINTGVDDDGF